MKINEPVTDNEVLIPDDEYIVSTTDLKGIITSVNTTFEKVSGFSREELVGANHNIVRHPDMPPEAFADLWQRIKGGKPWVGIVKNRCKNGDYYWVKASVVPLREGDSVVGYMSVRTRPGRAEVEQAEALYRDIRAGKASLKPSFAERLRERVRNLGVAPYLTAATLGSTLPLIAVAQAARHISSPVILGGLVVLFMSMLGVGAWLLYRYLRRPLTQVREVLEHIAAGDYYYWIDERRNDELGRIQEILQEAQTRFGYTMSEAVERAEELAAMQEEMNGMVEELSKSKEQLDKELESARQRESELNQVREALESVSAAVMMVDRENHIICANAAAGRMMLKREDAIRREYPDFDAGQLVGRHVDLFRRGWDFSELEDVVEEKIFVGGCEFRVIASPIRGEDGERNGTVLEWVDRTDQAMVEREFQAVVQAASSGDLSKRLRIEDKTSVFAELSGNVNGLLDVLEKLIKDTGDVFHALAQGDLTVSIDRDYTGEFARLRDDVNATVAQLTGVMGKIRYSTNALGQAAHEITEGNNMLAERVEQQASSLEETASSMEEITSTVRHNADNSRKASELSKQTLEKAVAGGEVVTETIHAMDKITEASKRISDIIGVIDDIAFQTNLLALNAAVEAARAGEQGRGFAVVASEVRNLAQRSASAAKEIKDLIRDSVGKVEEGSRLVNQSGETLDEIVASVTKVDEFFAEIAAASAEQYAGIDLVNQAVTQMDGNVQKNAALVEEVAQASQLMDEQARELRELVSYFKTVSQGGVESKEGGWDGVERRSPDRPWSGVKAPDLDFAAARTKHKLWKKRLRSFLDGEETMSEAEAASHHECDLGKWLYASGLDQFGDLPEMQELEKIHAEMHGLIKKVIRNKHAGQVAQAESVLKQVEEYSDRIVGLLDILEQKTSGGAGSGRSSTQAGEQAPVRLLQVVGGDEGWEDF